MNRIIGVPARVKPLLQRIGVIAEARRMSAYAVGGCVRDWLLGITQVVDLDVTVEGGGIEVARAVSRALKGSLQVHQQFGTATVRIPSTVRRLRHNAWRTSATTHWRTRADPPKQYGGRHAVWRAPSTVNHVRVDFATCRKETYAQPAAYPRVAPGTLQDDLFRRDFTINAIAVSLAPERFGSLIDPFGGARDLRARRLRILHAESFLDDPSRLLRGIRFAQRFGLRREPLTERAARSAMAAGALGWLNAGRLRKEFDRMAQEPDPSACFRALAKMCSLTTDH